jgi:hypothetical protein
MAKVRSPNYPALDLAAALKAARTAFGKDNRNRMSQAALGKHLGHDSLSGPALGKIGALRAYGLVEGKGDELKITDGAVHALMAPVGSPERNSALAQLAARPKLFQEIQKDFPTLPSQENLKFWLIKRHFAPDAAEKAVKSYLATMRLVAGGPEEYDENNDESEKLENPSVTPAAEPSRKAGKNLSPPPPPPPLPKSEERQAVFPLMEGDVKLIFPAAMSSLSAKTLTSYVNLFLEQARLQAEERERLKREYDREDE